MSGEDRDDLSVTKSGGDVFADLGLELSEEERLKVQIAQTIVVAINERNLTQVEAAEIMGIDQPKVSALMRGRLEGFSLQRLLNLVTALGRDVDIQIKKSRDPRGKVTVAA
jgi:predicted XRE-type DNA-binding protein